MSIDIRRFVDINLKHKEISSVNSIRDTAVLISSDTTSIALQSLIAKAKKLKLVPNDATFSTLKDLQLAMKISTSEQFYELYNTYNSETGVWTINLENATKYVDTFFENNGNKLIVITNMTETVSQGKTDVQTTIEQLENEFIVVAYTGTQSLIKTIAKSRASDVSIYGVNRKLLLMSVSANDTEKVDDLICKYTSNNEDVMTIAAYLTDIDIYGSNTVQDYCFTKETVKTVINDDTLFETLSTNNINVDVNLAGAVRNYGGNCKNGLDLVNEFVLIVLQQTLTDRVLLAMSTKLKNEQGLATIKTVMSEELNRYVRNGYLTTSKIWTDTDYTVTYNNQTFTVVEQDTALPLGYRIKILPYSSLTNEDKALHSTPPIYVVVADSYGIRKVTINGLVF